MNVYGRTRRVATVCGVRAGAGVCRPPWYAIRPHAPAYRRCSSGPRETGHLGIWAGGTWGIENGPPGGTWRGGSCRTPDNVLLGRPSVRIPNRPEKCVEPLYNHKRAVLNGYKIRLVILTNRERSRSNEACGDRVWRLRGRWGVSATRVRDTTPYIGLQAMLQRPARGRSFGYPHFRGLELKLGGYSTY